MSQQDDWNDKRDVATLLEALRMILFGPSNADPESVWDSLAEMAERRSSSD